MLTHKILIICVLFRCQSQNFKYSCPRCNIKYCSLDCYRSQAHRQCSEAFYKVSKIKYTIRNRNHEGISHFRNV